MIDPEAEAGMSQGSSNAPALTREAFPSGAPAYGPALIGLAVAGAAAWLLGIATLTITARRLGPEAFGLFNMGITTATCAAALAAPNLNVWGARLIASGQHTVAEAILLTKLPQLAVAIILSILVMLAAWRFAPADAATAIICSTPILVTTAAGLQWVAQGLGWHRAIAVNQLISACIAFVLTATLLAGPDTLWVAPVALACGQLVAAASLLWALARRGVVRWPALRTRPSSQALRPGASFAGSSVAAMLIMYAGFAGLSLFGDPADIGAYGAGARLYLAFMLVSALLSTVFFPRAVRLAQATAAIRRREATRWITLAGFASGLPAALMIGAPETVVHLLFGPSFNSAAPFVRAAGCGVFFSALSTAHGMCILAAGRDRWFLVASAAGACVALAGGLSVAYAGPGAAAISLAVTDLVVLLVLAPAFRRAYGGAGALALWRVAVAATAAIVLLLAGPADVLGLALAAALYLLIASPWAELRELGQFFPRARA